MIFEDQKKTADQIFDQVLRAKADGQPYYPRAGEDGGDVDSNLPQGRQNNEKPDEPDDNGPQDAHQRPDSLHGGFRNYIGNLRGTDQECFQTIEPEAQQSETYVGGCNDQNNTQRCLDKVDADFKKPRNKFFR